MTTESLLRPETTAPSSEADAPDSVVTRGSQRGRLVFYVAASAVALHVLDDNFLQPRSGTSAADHLVSGLVPLALLGLGIWAYPRVRTGAAALIALAIGLAGVIFGSLGAVNTTVAVGPSGDAYTGLLAIPTGVVLISLAVVRLWTSRRQTSNRPWRYLRRLLLGVISVLALYMVVLPITIGYMAAHTARAVVPRAELGTAYEDVTLTTSDGLQLEGWYVPSKNRAAVIVFPGRKGSQDHARMLASRGYGVLLFDRRGEGVSEGEPNIFGWGGDKDIYAALDFLEDRPDVDPSRIGGIGLSVGGELMLQAAAEDERLAAVVSEGAGTRTFAEELEEYEGPELWAGIPLLAIKTGAVSIFSNTMPPPKLTDLVPAIAPRPAMLIWAPNGGNVEHMNPTYRRLIGPSASIWEIPDAMHIKGITTHPDEYEQRVGGFFDEALLED